MIRPLGYNELYELAQYTLGHGRGVTTSCRYAIPAEAAVSDEALKKSMYTAITRVVLESPMLRVGIEGALSKRPVWVQLNTMNLEHHIEWVTPDDTASYESALQARIESELDLEFPDLESRPGWRVVILRHASHDFLDVVFAWNHANTDGMGGKVFHDKLLMALTEERENIHTADSDDTMLTLPETTEQFPPVTEGLVKLPMSLGWMLKQAWTESKPHFLFPNPCLAKWAPVKKLPYKSNFRTCTVSSTTVSGILAACRIHNTTITALLHGLVLFSLSSQTNEEEAPGFISLSALDVRRFLPSNPPSHPWFDPKKAMANYVSNLTHEFDSVLVSKVRMQIVDRAQCSTLMDDQLDTLWSVASRVRKDIQDRLDQGLKNDRLGLMKFVPNAREMFKNELQKPRTLSWAISNLGVMDSAPCKEYSPDSQQDRAWKISRAQFTLSTHIPEAALLMGAITVKGGEMVITCTWQDTTVETVLAERIVEDMHRWLSQIGKSSEAAP